MPDTCAFNEPHEEDDGQIVRVYLRNNQNVPSIMPVCEHHAQHLERMQLVVRL